MFIDQINSGYECQKTSNVLLETLPMAENKDDYDIY